MANGNGGNGTRFVPLWLFLGALAIIGSFVGLLYGDARSDIDITRDSTNSVGRQVIELKANIIPRLDDIIRRLDRIEGEKNGYRGSRGGE